jgi:hypothetical protein
MSPAVTDVILTAISTIRLSVGAFNDKLCAGKATRFVKCEGVVQELINLQLHSGMRWSIHLQNPTVPTASAFVFSDLALA